MAYTTKFTCSTKNHRIANVYDFKYTIVDMVGHKKTYKKKLIVPWEYYSRNDSCCSKTILENILYHCVLNVALHTYGRAFMSRGECSFTYNLIDRVDQTDKIVDNFEKFANFGKYANLK